MMDNVQSKSVFWLINGLKLFVKELDRCQGYFYPCRQKGVANPTYIYRYETLEIFIASYDGGYNYLLYEQSII